MPEPSITRLRDLPRVDDLLADERWAAAARRLGRGPVRAAIRDALATLRTRLRAGALPGGAVPEAIEEALRGQAAPTIRRVINASGVILHTNLGRAPLSTAALAAAAEAAAGYTDLELDLASGRRGKRGEGARALLCALTGADAALVVNNNAAAVLLALAATAGAGREVLVSRGELVEIGGSFRMPDVMALSGARLVEVGTTNRTRAADFAAALTPRTAAILRVHRGNFRLHGFCESPALADVVAVGAAADVPVLVDLGHGALEPLGLPAGDGLPDTVGGCLAAGAAVVLSSGDKLLGGPQAGVAVGRADLIGAMAAHPLHRAVRADKLALAALAAVLADHRAERLDDIPALRMIREAPAAVEARARDLAARLKAAGCAAAVGPSEAVVGGGTDADFRVPSSAVVITPNHGGAAALGAALRTGSQPVVGRVADGAVWLDLRTVSDSEVEGLAHAALAALTGRSA